MSLDGFVAGADVGPAEPMGRGGEALHAWMESEIPTDVEAKRTQAARPGAVILGRTTYDVGRRFWGGTPYPVQSFVLTHREADPDPGFDFVGSGIEEALYRARAVSGERAVVVMGASTARQFLAAGMVDELALQIIPVLLGSGERLFDGAPPTSLTLVDAKPSSAAVHLTYRADS